jgi:hypothetical protein
MKKLTLLFILSAACLFLSAQSRSVKVEYQKEPRLAIENDVPFPVKTVEDAIADTFAKLGYKATTSKGFTVYKGVRIPELGSESWDIYFMVEKKSKKDKENSTVTMMISKGFDAFVTESNDGAIIRKGKSYLDSMRNMLASYDLEQQITVQEDELKSAEKKSLNLLDDGKSLEKKKRKLEEDIADNIKDQEKQVREIEKQKQILEVMKGKRRTN